MRYDQGRGRSHDLPGARFADARRVRQRGSAGANGRSVQGVRTRPLVRFEMSCDNHAYKAVEINHPTDQYTAGQCEVYTVSDWYQIDGYIGSAIFSCDATAR